MVAVLSARGKHTDELVSLAYEVSGPARPARDGHAALHRRARDLRARGDGDQRPRPRGDLAHRLPGRASSPTAATPRRASSRSRPTASGAALDDGKIVLVAGFQGVSQDSLDVTTLGRGGSDTTAVALAAALGAEVCEIYTDVAGVFSADPRIVPEARKLPVVTFEEMLEMSASGAGVLQLRSVEYARNHGVTHPLPIELRGWTRYGGPGRGADHGTTARHSRDPLDRRGADHPHRAAGRARHRRPRAHRARRGEHQRRHDHPERAAVRGPPGRHVVHGPARRRGDRARVARGAPGRARLRRGASPTTAWGRCRSSAPE